MRNAITSSSMTTQNVLINFNEVLLYIFKFVLGIKITS